MLFGASLIAAVGGAKGWRSGLESSGRTTEFACRFCVSNENVLDLFALAREMREHVQTVPENHQNMKMRLRWRSRRAGTVVTVPEELRGVVCLGG